MGRVGSLVLGLLLGGSLHAADDSLLRFTLHGISPDHDLDFSGPVDDVDGSWDVGLRLGLDAIGRFDRFAGIDLAMGAGIGLSWLQQDDQTLRIAGGLRSEMDTRLVGGSARYYAGVIGGGEAFAFEVLPYIGVGIHELRWELEGDVDSESLTDVDWVWDFGMQLNATTSFGEHWQFGLGGGVFYRSGDFDYALNVGDVGIGYRQFGFEYGLLGGISF